MTDIEPEILDDESAFDFYRSECIKDVQAQLVKWSSSKIDKRESFSLAHNFLPGHNSNDPIVRKACENGYVHKIVYVGITNIETCIRRVQLRTVKGYHYVPDSDIKERYVRGLNQFNELFKKLLTGERPSIPFDEIRILDYTRDVEMENIADYKAGRLEIMTNDSILLDKWKELLPEMFRLV